MEQRLGSFEAMRKTDIYQTFVSDQRFVAVRIGGQLDGGKAVTAHFGLLGALIGYFIDKRVQKKRAALREQNSDKTLDELLLSDKKNFEVRFDALEKVELKKGGFFSGGRASLMCSQLGQKPLELKFQTKLAHQPALLVLEQALHERLQVDPKLR